MTRENLIDLEFLRPKDMSLTENSNHFFFLWFGSMVHSYMKSIKSKSAILIKCNMHNADEQKYISQMSAINVYD